MTKLNEKEWRKFPAFGENGFLHIQTTSSSIDAINLINGKDKIIPYITRSDSNNGLSRFVSDENYVFGSDESGCITVGLDTQTAFYQPHKFVTGQNVQIITGNVIDDETAHFLVSILREQMKAKFNWGGNGATLTRMKRLDVLLPVNDLGLPDFTYMGDYVRNHRNIMLDNYRNYAKTQLENLDYIDISSLNEKVWKPFFIVDIFNKDNIKRGKRLTKANQKKGNIPYVSSSSLNNGVDNFIEVDNKKMRTFSNCLSIANSGSVGSSFYEPFEFVASDHVTHLENPNFNKYIYLFIATMTNRWADKYNFNREINEPRMMREKVLLPINNDGEPDYEYMEQYSKNLMYVKYKQYLDYLDKKSV